MKQILTLLFVCCACISYAQTTPDGESAAAVQTLEPAPSPTLEELSAEVETLKTKVSTWEKIRAHLPQISGFLQVGYEYCDDKSNFFVKRARVTFAGDIVPKLDYKIQVEFASPMHLSEAFLQYKPFPQLNFKLGEYKIPFSIENTDYSPLKIEFIENALAVRRLIGFDDVCGLSCTGRDLGFTTWGGFLKRDGYCILNYDLGVFNGEGLNTKDKNKSKDIVARLSVKPVAGLQVAGSYYWGEYGADYLKRIRYGAGFSYDRGPIVVRGEYICGTTGMATDGGIEEMKSGGWFAVVGCRIKKKLQPAFRYDTFRMDCSDPSTRQTNYTAAMVWQPVKYLRCQLDYTYEDFAAKEHAGRNVVALMLTGMF